MRFSRSIIQSFLFIAITATSTANANDRVVAGATSTGTIVSSQVDNGRIGSTSTNSDVNGTIRSRTRTGIVSKGQNVRKRNLNALLTRAAALPTKTKSAATTVKVTATTVKTTTKTVTSVIPAASPVPKYALQPDNLPIRINSGYTASDWIDSKTKYKWKMDTLVTDPTTQGVVENLCGGTIDALWCSYRQGTIIDYAIPVLESRERYKITLLIDEPMFSSPNLRLFDIYVEGVLAKSKIDPYSISGGKNTIGNVTIALNDRIKDGVVNLSFRAVPTPKNGLQKAIVNGIIVEISPYRQLVDFPLRINCGMDVPWIDPITKLEWLPDTDYDKLTLPVNDCGKKPNTAVPNDQLYCNYRLGSIINYAVRVLDFAARYKVTIYMQEPSFMGPGLRLMDIFVEDKVINGGFDIVKFAGARNKPTSFSIITDKILDGVINIKLKSSSGKTSTGQKVLISGIMVERT